MCMGNAKIPSTAWHAARLEAAGSVAKPCDIDELIKTGNRILASERLA
jgi:hypothetical protein